MTPDWAFMIVAGALGVLVRMALAALVVIGLIGWLLS